LEEKSPSDFLGKIQHQPIVYQLAVREAGLGDLDFKYLVMKKGKEGYIIPQSGKLSKSSVLLEYKAGSLIRDLRPQITEEILALEKSTSVSKESRHSYNPP